MALFLLGLIDKNPDERAVLTLSFQEKNGIDNKCSF